jgi:Bacterial regulatory helix-turn-helix protein, lysR family
MTAFDDLPLLRAFIGIVKCGSICAAARRLKIPQPTLSRYLRVLEERCDGPLLRRDTHQMSLTQTGRRFLADANAMVAHAEEADQPAARSVIWAAMFNRGGSIPILLFADSILGIQPYDWQCQILLNYAGSAQVKNQFFASLSRFRSRPAFTGWTWLETEVRNSQVFRLPAVDRPAGARLDFAPQKRKCRQLRFPGSKKKLRKASLVLGPMMT